MIQFKLNGIDTIYTGDESRSLLDYLRKEQGITSVKDGCSGQAACGACTVEMDGKAVLSCSTPMKKVKGAEILTIDGFPEKVKDVLASAFVVKGAIQCGFCTPGILARVKILLQKNPNPTREQIIKALKAHLCRCTGYVKIIEAVKLAAEALRENKSIAIETPAKVGTRQPKYDAYQKALGQSPFVDDLKFDNMLHAALKF